MDDRKENILDFLIGSLWHVNMSETTRLLSYNIFTGEWATWEDNDEKD